jgi:CRISPR system Cascade subunit CasD
MEVLLLRLTAPLMSFGAVKVDQQNKTDSFPYRAMLTGLCANALGYLHAEDAAHEALQRRLRYAARQDCPGSRLVDFQTVDFGPRGSLGSNLGWTTHGRLEERKGGDASEGTHIRYRHYLVDALLTVAVTLAPATAGPTVRELAAALQAPARPLFLGRKCCLPSEPIFRRMVEATTLRQALEAEPRAERAQPGPLAALWPEDERTEDDAGHSVPVVRVEDRDWANDIHVGRRLYVQGLMHPPEASHAHPE